MVMETTIILVLLIVVCGVAAVLSWLVFGVLQDQKFIDAQRRITRLPPLPEPDCKVCPYNEGKK